MTVLAEQQHQDGAQDKAEHRQDHALTYLAFLGFALGAALYTISPFVFGLVVAWLIAGLAVALVVGPAIRAGMGE